MGGLGVAVGFHETAADGVFPVRLISIQTRVMTPIQQAKGTKDGWVGGTIGMKLAEVFNTVEKQDHGPWALLKRTTRHAREKANAGAQGVIFSR